MFFWEAHGNATPNCDAASKQLLLFVRKWSANTQTFRHEFHRHLSIFIGSLPTAIVDVKGTLFPIENNFTSLPNEKRGAISLRVV
jgi:hypothetical protein